MSAVRELPPIEASADIMAMARDNCAERLRARGEVKEAEAFERGDRDFAWAMRHEVTLLKGQAAK